MNRTGFLCEICDDIHAGRQALSPVNNHAAVIPAKAEIQ
jgi:hypothetical protein